MKKYFSMLVVAALGLFTSCSEDALVGGEEGGELTTISVTAPQLGLGTRAGATAFADPALSDMRVTLIISTEDQQVVTVTTKTHSFGTGSTPCTFEARLYKGKTYNLSAWADYGAEYYTIPTQPATAEQAAATKPVIKMASTTIKGNLNKYDAYFGNETKALTENTTVNIVLSRPFALVKVNTTDWNENAVKLAGYRPDAYATTFNAPTQLNLVSGVADEAADITTSAEIVEYDQDGNPKQLHYDYLFANTTAKILDAFTVEYKQNGATSSDYTFENIPVQRNYQTNITGNILTKNGKINVTINPLWYQPDTEIVQKEVDTTSDANDDLESNKGDSKGKDYIIKKAEDGDNTIIIPDNTAASSLGYTIEDLGNNNSITVKDQTPGTQDKNYKKDVTLTVPEVTGTKPTIYVNTQSAHVTVIGDANVVYANTSDHTFVVGNGSTIAKIVAQKGNIEVYGTVTDIERDAQNPDAVTYVDIYDNGVWTNEAQNTDAKIIVRRPVARIGHTIYVSLEDALKAVNDGEIIVMGRDHQLTSSLLISNGKEFTFDLAGHTLTGRVNVSGAKVTFKNGTLDGASGQALNAYGSQNPAYADQVFTYICVAQDVTLKGTYGMCFLSYYANSYFPYSYGVKVDFFGKSLCVSPAYVSGNIGNDQQDYGDVSAYAPAGINSRSKAMFLYGPEFNVYGELTCTGSAEENPQGITLSGMIRVNVYPGAKITGSEGIGMKSGNVHVYGGTIKSTGAKVDPVQAVQSGSEASGAAISITSYYTNDFYADRAKMSVVVEGGDITAINNSALLVTHSYSGGQPVALKQGVDLAISGGSFAAGSDVPVIFIDNAATGDAFEMPSKFISGGTYNKEPNAEYIAKGYEAVHEGSVWNVKVSAYNQLAEVIENTPVGGRVSIYGESFKKAADGFCYKDAAKKTGRLVYLTVVSPGKDGVNASIKVSTDPTATARTIQNLFLGSENRLNAPGTLLKNGDIVVLPNETLFIEDQSTIYDMYGDITWLGEPNGKSVIKPWQSAGSKNYRFFRIYNRYKKTVEDNVIYHYNFKNVVFDGSLEKNSGANLFVVTCYNIQMNMENCVVKNFPGSVFSIWANDTYDNAQAQTPGLYPTKADNVGVEVNLTGTICQGNGRLVHFDCSPYQVRDIDAGYDRYAFIHVNYDNTCTISNTEMYSVNANTAKGQGNCLLNGVDIWPAQ